MKKPLTGRKVLVILLSSFAVVMGVNVFFIVEAVNTFSGEDEQHPYLQGIDYNDTLKARAEQAALGWHAEITAARDARGGAVVIVNVADAAGKPLSDLKLAGELRHPADAERDHALELAAVESGRYAGRVPGVGSGAWDVIVRAAGKTPFEAQRRIWLR